ncbi:MAG TPA: DUF3488 and transglutaminase-like domain-containing protein, partial [Actinomycetota bacterium]|nr:DUF3488 and transglutaminase-like domain-containing protein [Actinomycetota bacterium]
PMTLLSVSLVVGTSVGGAFYVLLFLVALLTYWGLESSHRLRSWGRWVSAWKHQKEPEEPKSLTGELGRRLGAACVLGAFVAPLFLPALGDGLISWRSGFGSGTGDGDGNGSGRSSVNPWVSIEPSLVEQSDRVLFTVTATEAAYWRVASLEHFDGLVWGEFDGSTVESPDGSIVGPTASLTQTRAVSQRIEIVDLGGTSLPAATQPGRARRTGDGEDPVAGIRYDRDGGAIVLEDELEEGDGFEVVSAVPDVTFQELRDAPLGDPGEQYLRLPPISSAVEEVLDEWTGDAKTPFDQLRALQARLRGFDYTLEPDLPTTDDYLSEFLLEVQAGYCQQFATAFAVMARMLDIPTRVSVGYLPGSASAAEADTFTVQGTDAHAWPEVYFEGLGWIAFEPTPRSGALAEEPGYTQPRSATAGNFDPQNPFSDTGADNLPGGRGGGAFEEAGGASPLTDGAPVNPPGGAGAGAAGRAEWQRTFSTLVTFLALAIFLFLASVPAIKELRTRRRYARAGDADAVAEAAFVEFQEEAAELAQPRAPSESALAYALRMAKVEGVVERSAVRLASIYEAAAYAGSDITPQQAEEARRLARRLRSQLWHGASWWSRAQRLFSPRRLVPG